MSNLVIPADVYRAVVNSHEAHDVQSITRFVFNLGTLPVEIQVDYMVRAFREGNWRTLAQHPDVEKWIDNNVKAINQRVKLP